MYVSLEGEGFGKSLREYNYYTTAMCKVAYGGEGGPTSVWRNIYVDDPLT